MDVFEKRNYELHRMYRDSQKTKNVDIVPQEYDRSGRLGAELNHTQEELNKIREVLSPEPYVSEDGNVN